MQNGGTQRPGRQIRRERLAANQSRFREINERLVTDLGVMRTEASEEIEAVCECGHLRCDASVTLPRDAYEAVRSDSRMFVIAPGHDLPEVESVVDEHGAYAIVKKHEDLADLLQRSDPPRTGA